MIGALLLDADGVLQRVGGDGWRARFDAHLGDRVDDCVAQLGAMEEPALVGKGDFPAALARWLAVHAPEVDAEELYVGVWLDIETLDGTVAVVEEVRRRGIGVHLVTNQHPRRATHMKRLLGYGDLLDRSFYSCDLGLAKPDPRFFQEVAERLGLPPGELLVVDDSRDNVAGAREAGLAAEYWHHDLGTDVLRDQLGRYGVLVPGPGSG